MVGSPFILINKNGCRTLLNATQIISVSDLDVLLTDAVRRILWEYPPGQEVAYIVQVVQPGGPKNFLFTDAAERDELLDKLIAAISPSATINSAPGLPHTWPELARMVPTRKHILEGIEYATRAEYEQARAELHHREVLEDMEAARRIHPTSQEAPAPPTPKPPRKPYTRKPRE